MKLKVFPLQDTEEQEKKGVVSIVPSACSSSDEQ